MTKEFSFDLDPASLNLDGMMPEDLAEYATHLEVLLDYARAKRRAMVLRAEGKVTYAMTIEDHCDALYGCLPKNWQW